MNSKSFYPGIIVGSAILMSAMMLWHRGRPLEAEPASFPVRINEPRWPAESFPHLQSLARDKDPLEQSRAATAMVSHLSPQDFPALIERCRNLRPAPEPDSIQLLYSAWARVDPVSAARHAGCHSADLRAVLKAWSLVAPEAALAWIEANASSDMRAGLLGATLPALLECDQASIQKLLSTLPDRGRKEAIQELAASVARKGNEATALWLNSMTEPQWRYEALTAVIQNCAPDEAVDWMNRYSQELESRENGLDVKGLFSGWSLRDFDSAKNAFEKLSPGSAMHHDALCCLINHEAQTDPEAAKSLLNRFPDEADEALLISFSRAVLRKDPELAADLTLKIPTPNTEILTVLSRWSGHDAPAARAWLERNPIEPHLQQYLPESLQAGH